MQGHRHKSADGPDDRYTTSGWVLALGGLVPDYGRNPSGSLAVL